MTCLNYLKVDNFIVWGPYGHTAHELSNLLKIHLHGAAMRTVF